MNEYLNPWYILEETGTRRHVIMMHFGNGDTPNALLHLHNTLQTVTKRVCIPELVLKSQLTSKEMDGMTGLHAAPRGWHWASVDETPPSFHIVDKS